MRGNGFVIANLQASARACVSLLYRYLEAQPVFHLRRLQIRCAHPSQNMCSRVTKHSAVSIVGACLGTPAGMDWSAPLIFKISGGGIGATIGAQHWCTAWIPMSRAAVLQKPLSMWCSICEICCISLVVPA